MRPGWRAFAVSMAEIAKTFIWLTFLIHSALGPAEVQELERQFSRQPTEDILGWAWERFGTRAAIGTSFQGVGSL